MTTQDLFIIDEDGNLIITDEGGYIIGEESYMTSINPTELSQNMLFFDINYLAYGFVSGDYLHSETIDFAFDNRSDKGYCTFLTTTGNLLVNFGVSVGTGTTNILPYPTLTDAHWELISSATVITSTQLFYTAGAAVYEVHGGTADSFGVYYYAGSDAPSLSLVEISAYFKAGVVTMAVVGVYDYGAVTTTVFNLSDGTIHTGSGIILDVGGGWYRCSIDYNLTGFYSETSQLQFRYGAANVASDSSAYLYMAQPSVKYVSYSGGFYLKDFFICNHNFQNGRIAVYTNAGWQTITSFNNLTTNMLYYSHESTLQAFQFRLVFSTTQDNYAGRMGELIATKKKFQLNNNPDAFSYVSLSIGKETTLRSGRSVYNEIDDVYAAQLNFEHLMGDFVSMTGSDLQNITELSRQKASFLFWPNANNAGYPDLWGMRPTDIFRCKFINSTAYEFPNPSRIDIGKGNFALKEV